MLMENLTTSIMRRHKKSPQGGLDAMALFLRVETNTVPSFRLARLPTHAYTSHQEMPEPLHDLAQQPE